MITVFVLFVFNASIQLAGVVGSLNQISAQRAVADYLHAHFDPNSNARIFSDEGTVVAMSGIPPERFVSSSDAPREPGQFLGYLKEQNVEYVVFITKADSTPVKLFPDLEYGEPAETFELVLYSYSEFLPMHIWLYRVR